jgi:hypothetical protein
MAGSPERSRLISYWRELKALYELGFRGAVFIVQDNFIGNHKRALELVQSLESGRNLFIQYLLSHLRENPSSAGQLSWS